MVPPLYTYTVQLQLPNISCICCVTTISFSYQALGTLITHFPKEMAAFLGDVLPHVWNTLTQGADRYHKTVINYIEDADDPVDSDGRN